MQRALVAMVCLSLGAACCVAAQDGFFNNAVYVTAGDGVFALNSGGKQPLSQALACDEVRDFLETAGATTAQRVFPNFQPSDTLSYDEFGNPVRLIDLSRYYKIQFNDSVFWKDLLASWDGTADFLVVGQAGYYTSDYVVPNDPYWNSQLHLQASSSEGLPRIAQAWDYTTGSAGVKIGVIDNGFDRDHEDLITRIAATYRHETGNADADPVTPTEDHGTHVAGTVGAATNNAVGVAGVNWQSPLYLTRAAEYFDVIGIPTPIVLFGDDLAAGCVDWLRGQGANTINMSFGNTDGYFEEVLRSILWRNAMAASCYNAWIQDVLLVASKGNDNSTNTHRPSDLRTIMGIGSCDLRGVRSYFSNYGPGLDVLTLGEDVLSTVLDNSYGTKWGTSMAAPIATGVTSLLKSYRNDLTADEIEQIIELTAKDRGDPGWDAEHGWGIIKADSALSFVANNEFFRLDATGFSRYKVQDVHEHHFVNEGSPGQTLAAGAYFVETWRLVHHFDFPEYNFQEAPTVLIRNRGAQGWGAENPNPMFPWGRAVPGSVTTTGCDIETYAYFIKYNLLGQTLNLWYPCNGQTCSGNPNVKFQITLAGLPGVAAPDYFDASMHWDTFKQVVVVYFSDPNDFEAGYVIERQPATTGLWERVDSLGPQVGPYVEYWDSTYTGSEVYSYRVGACRQDGAVVYSDIATFKTQPRRPDNFNPHIYYSRGECGSLVLSKETAPLAQPDPDPADIPTDSCRTNKIIVEWDPPANQLLPIDHYRVIREQSYYNYTVYYTDTCRLEICPNPKNTSFYVEITAFDIEGDSSKTYRKGVTTGWQDACLGNITKAHDEEAPILPTEPTLSANYPNPFNPSTSVTLSLPSAGHIRAEIYNALGQLVDVLLDGYVEAGEHHLTWDSRNTTGREVASGVYFFRVTGDSFSVSRKMMLVR